MRKKFNFIVFIMAFLLLINPFMTQGVTVFATSEDVDVSEVEENTDGNNASTSDNHDESLNEKTENEQSDLGNDQETDPADDENSEDQDVEITDLAAEMKELVEIDSEQIETAIENATNFILNKGVTSEWEAIGIAQAGKEVPEIYLEEYFYQRVQNQIVRGLENGRIKITDIERLAMAAVAVGQDPQNVNDLNLIELIYNSPDRTGGFDSMTYQGNNGLIFALIALDTLSFPVPEDARWTRQDIINELLRSQNEDGSWSLNPIYPDPSVDITGMALIGLSPYKDQPAVSEALDSAVVWLSSVQTENGGFDGGDFVGGITSEATSQVIIGLSSYGIDPAGEQFTKNGNHLISHLLEYQNDDGGFKHTMDYDYSDSMATEQALQALVAYDYFLKGKGSLYQFDTIDDIDDEENLDDLDNNENRDEEETEQNERDDMNSEEANEDRKS